MIPTMMVFGLITGRWWRFALLSAAIVWPLILVVDGVTTAPGTLFAGAVLGVANAVIGVLVHQAILWVARATRSAVRRQHPAASRGS